MVRSKKAGTHATINTLTHSVFCRIASDRSFRIHAGKGKDTTVSDILQFTEAIARQAGAVLMAGYGNVRQIQHKGAIDLVTEFDKRSEEVIISAIQREFPDRS